MAIYALQTLQGKGYLEPISDSDKGRIPTLVIGTATSNTDLTKAILDKVILVQTAADADGTFDTQYAVKGTEDVAAAALPSASFTDAAVTGKLLTGYSSSTGVVSATDSILTAIGKLNGNIASSIVGAIIYKSTFDASAGNFSVIVDPRQGWLYKVSVAGTISGTLFSVGDNIYINKDVTGTPTLADIDLIDNTEAADILREGDLAEGQIFVGSASNIATAVSMSGEATIVASGAVTLDNDAVIGKVLTGFTAGAGVVAATDSILAAIQKIDGNVSALSGDFTSHTHVAADITDFSAEVQTTVDNKRTVTCGESFAANKTFVVRVGIAGETIGRVYKASKLVPADGKFWAIGFIQTGAAGLIAGDQTVVVDSGALLLKSGDTNFAEGTEGKPLFLHDAGAFSVTAPEVGLSSGTLYASVIVGKVFGRYVTLTDSNLWAQQPQMMGVASAP